MFISELIYQLYKIKEREGDLSVQIPFSYEGGNYQNVEFLNVIDNEQRFVDEKCVIIDGTDFYMCEDS
jgi:hypothetical protein